MPDFRQSWLTYVLGAILVAFAAFIFLNPTKAKAGGIAELEFSGGLGVADDQLKSSGAKVDLNQTGALGAVGLGYTYLRSDGMFLGAAGRFNLMHVIGDVGISGGGEKIKSDQLWEAYAKLGRCWHTALDKCKVAFYGIAGWSWMNLDLKDVGAGVKHPEGLLLGGGIDTHISGPWYAKLEYGWHNFNGLNVGGDKLNPDLHIIRVGLALKFGETARVPIVDDVISGVPCDSKLPNCKPLK